MFYEVRVIIHAVNKKKGDKERQKSICVWKVGFKSNMPFLHAFIVKLVVVFLLGLCNFSAEHEFRHVSR